MMPNTTWSVVVLFSLIKHQKKLIPEWEWCYIRTKIEFILLYGSYFGVVL